MGFLTLFKHLVSLKIKVKNIILQKLYFRLSHITQKNGISGGFLLNKYPNLDPAFLPNDPKRPDPQYWFRHLVMITLKTEEAFIIT